MLYHTMIFLQIYYIYFISFNNVVYLILKNGLIYVVVLSAPFVLVFIKPYFSKAIHLES